MSAQRIAKEFALANRAFDLFTLAERERALTEFARLRYESIPARFYEAVYVVVTSQPPWRRTVNPCLTSQANHQETQRSKLMPGEETRMRERDMLSEQLVSLTAAHARVREALTEIANTTFDGGAIAIARSALAPPEGTKKEQQ